MADKTSSGSTPSIEKAMERLDTLVKEMESGQLPLEKLISTYEEGVKLIRLCQEKLDAAEQKIQIISRSASGPTGIEEFHPIQNES